MDQPGESLTYFIWMGKKIVLVFIESSCNIGHIVPDTYEPSRWLEVSPGLQSTPQKGHKDTLFCHQGMESRLLMAYKGPHLSSVFVGR